jgi:acetylornithine deacetylase
MWGGSGFIVDLPLAGPYLVARVSEGQSRIASPGGNVSLSRQEKLVLSHLDLEGMLSFLGELVAIPSLGGMETPAQELVARWMEENGLEVDLWELDLAALRAHPAYSAEIHRDEAQGVVGLLGENEGGRKLILNGHVDVVPPGDLSKWSFSPWAGDVVAGQVRGRGALDMKGGLACGLFVAKAIREAGVRLDGQLILESVVGEEDGGVGTLAAILRGYRADGAVIMEPTGLAICPAQAGALSFRITIRGKAAHGCVRDQGVSALEKLFPVYQELLALEARRNDLSYGPLFRAYKTPFPLSVGVVQGGDWPSSVPDWLQVEGRYGLMPGESVDEAQAAFLTALAAAAAGDPWLRDHPPELEWWGGRFLPADSGEDEAVVTILRESVSEVLGIEPRLEGVPYGSDLRHLVLEGHTPAVLFGPGNVTAAHAVDEMVAVEELERTMRSLAVMALRFCTRREDDGTET